MAVGTGEGSEMWRSADRCDIPPGGFTAVSTLITLVIVPVGSLYICRELAGVKHARAAKSQN